MTSPPRARILGRVPYAVLAPHAARAAALAGAGICTAVGWRLLDNVWENFGTSLRWFALATLLLIAVSVPLPRREWLRFRWASLAGFLRAHRWEMAGVAVVMGVAVFMRVFWFGTLPPSDGVSFEEAQAGGGGYSILHFGIRPVDFAITNYTAALGLKVFGSDITDLRLPFVIAGIASVGVMYALLRLMVSAPVALFVAFLFASNRWHAFGSGIADEIFYGTALAIVAAALLVAVLRFAHPLFVVALGLVSGALLYEYTAFKMIPFLVVGMMAAALGFWALKKAWRRREEGEEALRLVGRKWWLAPLFFIAVLTVASPLIVSSLVGGNKHFYEAFQRHTEVQEQVGPFGIVPEMWGPRLKAVTEVFLPFGPRTYSDDPPLNLPGKRMLDPVTAGLGVVAMAYAVLTWYRPYRLFFAVWLFVGLFVAAVVPPNFTITRFSGLLPPLFALIAFVVQDSFHLLRRAPEPARRAAYLGLVPLALWAFAVNVDVFRQQADSRLVRQSFASPEVNLCDFARDLGPDTYVYVWSDIGPQEALFQRSDFSWVCADLVGQPLNSVAEVWPLEPGDRANVALVYQKTAAPWPDLFPPLNEAYSEIEAPARTKSAYDSYTLTAYEVPSEAILQQGGLHGRYAGAPAAEPGVTPAPLFVDGGDIDWPAGATSVRWEGLVRLRVAATAALAPAADRPMSVLVDGEPVYSFDGATWTLSPIPLAVGWHTLQIDLARAGDEPLPPLVWRTTGGDPPAIRESDFFALSPLRGWAHERSARYGDQELIWRTVELYPATGWEQVWLPAWLFDDAGGTPPPGTGQVTSDEWCAMWHIEVARTYVMNVSARSGEAVLRVDGAVVLTLDTASGRSPAEERVGLEAGEHRIELSAVGGGGVVGANLAIQGTSATAGDFTPC